MKILPQKKGINKSLWVKKFIKNIIYSRDEIFISICYRENLEKEAMKSIASGWVGAATGKDKISDFNIEISTSTGRNKSCACSVWLPSYDLLQTIKIVLPNTIHGCKRKNLKHL